MGTPFDLVALCEAKNVESGKSKLWASIKIEPRGKALEADRAPLAIALVLDTSGSMQGDPLAHALQSCELVADLLSPKDHLAVVTFSSHAAVHCGLAAMDVAGRANLKNVLRGVRADGHTNLHGGLGVAAGVLMTAPAGLRRVAVVMSDGHPNIGLSSAVDLGAYVRTLGVAVSSLGFGLQHDENVLDAIAVAGSGRYTYIADPRIARVELARAALAQGGIVADHMELRLKPADGVEVLQVVPTSQLRVGGGGLAMSVGDVFVDEGRSFAVELALDLKSGATGRLVEVVVAGQAADGTPHTATAMFSVDIRSGARVADLVAQREILLVRADAARVEARSHADRGAMPAAVVILRDIAKQIDALEGFVRDDGSLIAEMREQLEDEIANYERKADVVEYAHQRKAAVAVRSATPHFIQVPRAPAPIAAVLIPVVQGADGPPFRLMTENAIGRVMGNDIVLPKGNLSKRHSRIMFTNNQFMLVDLGSTNGTYLNGKRVQTACALVHGDMITLGDFQYRFELVK